MRAAASFKEATRLAKEAGLTLPTVNVALGELERLGIAEEVAGRKRGRVFAYRRYAQILGEGTAPLDEMP